MTSHPDTNLSADAASSTHAARAAALRFIQGLSDGALLPHVTRIETRLLGADADLALSFDRLFADAWPAAGPAPHHEVTWGALAAAREMVAIAAFDHGGRPLLRESYGLGAAG